jgi:UDP-N-acetylglucosamine--N-acetylmuramyl-(pentapeptide) pyrophosphoryl-undecaprenol N-acetylglucosamine transferase
MKSLNILMSGGGTGGHIFPAVAIAQEIKKQYPQANILFVGALGRMEMEKVPQAGFAIEGVNIAGFNRGQLLSNLGLPFKLISSLWKVRKIIKTFKPDMAIGTGGFASGPALFVANALQVPIFVQEQNSFPGLTNRYLGSKAKAVFTAYPDMQKFFLKTTCHYFGNPVRESLLQDLQDTASAKLKMGLDPNKLSVLVVGGSLGARSVNTAIKGILNRFEENQVQLLWQTGKLDFPSCQDLESGFCQVHEFIHDMPLAYSAADIIISRAGAIAISELCLVKKPVILVPLPTAAADHQTQNAQALASQNAAVMVNDAQQSEKLWPALKDLVESEEKRQQLSQNIANFALPKATQNIVAKIKDILKLN